MKHNQKFLISIGIITLLFVATIVYNLFQGNDSYRYFTGLGDSIAISPDDSKVAFSYFINGNEEIYIANIDGTSVKKLTEQNGERHHAPTFSSDGENLLYLGKDSKGIQSLYIINRDGSKSMKLTDKEKHVNEAIFSPINNMIYFTAMPAKYVIKGDEGVVEEGYHLFSISYEGNKLKKLTSKDHYTMDSLSISSNGNEIFYTTFNGNNEVPQSFVLNDQGKQVTFPKNLPSDVYSVTFSPDESKLAYTAVSKQSKSSLFEYELFLTDLKTDKTTQLTKFRSSVTSPVFFHHENKIAFLEQRNWADDPAKYELKTIDLDHNKIKTVPLKVTNKEGNLSFMKPLDRLLSSYYTVVVLYTLLLGLLTVYFHYRSRKTFLPVIISISLAILTFISSFIIAAAISDPWSGIAIAMIALALFACSIIVLVFAFFLKRFSK